MEAPTTESFEERIDRTISKELSKVVLTTEAEKKQKVHDRLAKARAAKKPGKKRIVKPKETQNMTSTEESNIIIGDMPLSEAKAASSPAIKLQDDEIKWFTEVDFNDKGKVANDYPAYYYDGYELLQLQEEVRRLEKQLDEGMHSGPRLVQARRNLAKKKGRLQKIEDGRPIIKGAIKDKVKRSKDELAERISESMFSYDAHWKQIADPQIVARRMVEPCIDVKDEVVYSYAKQRGMRIEKGKISQNDASVIYKVFSKVLDEQSSTDVLRPTRMHGITE